MIRTALACTVAALAAVTGAAVASAAPAPAPTSPLAATTIKYDVDGAAELASQVDEAVGIWNAKLKNVRFEKGTGGISASTHDNGPAPGMASCLRCTKGTVKFYRQQIKEKKAGTLRVIVHELGHILGLDHPAKLHQESEVMSGGPFTQPNPSAQEYAMADAKWAGSDSSPGRTLTGDHDQDVFSVSPE